MFDECVLELWPEMIWNGHQRALNQSNKCVFAYFICGTALTCPLGDGHRGNIWCARIPQLCMDFWGTFYICTCDDVGEAFYCYILSVCLWIGRVPSNSYQHRIADKMDKFYDFKSMLSNCWHSSPRIWTTACGHRIAHSKWKKLSCSQAQLGQATCLDVA